MVESVSNAAISTLLRAQNAGLSNATPQVKGNSKAADAIISQFQDELGTSPAKGSRDLQPSNITSSLPRGSLVNILV